MATDKRKQTKLKWLICLKGVECLKEQSNLVVDWDRRLQETHVEASPIHHLSAMFCLTFTQFIVAKGTEEGPVGSEALPTPASLLSLATL